MFDDAKVLKHGDVEVTALDGVRGRRYMFRHLTLGVTVFKSPADLESLCRIHEIDPGDERVIDVVAEEMIGFLDEGDRNPRGRQFMPEPVTDEVQLAFSDGMRDRYGF